MNNVTLQRTRLETGMFVMSQTEVTLPVILSRVHEKKDHQGSVYEKAAGTGNRKNRAVVQGAGDANVSNRRWSENNPQRTIAASMKTARH